jgi:hypothetical protein
MKKVDTDKTCSTLGDGERRIHSFSQEALKGRDLPGKLRHIWEDNIKIGVECDDDYICLAQDDLQCLAFVCTVMKFEGSLK